MSEVLRRTGSICRQGTPTSAVKFSADVVFYTLRTWNISLACDLFRRKEACALEGDSIQAIVGIATRTTPFEWRT